MDCLYQKTLNPSKAETIPSSSCVPSTEDRACIQLCVFNEWTSPSWKCGNWRGEFQWVNKAGNSWDVRPSPLLWLSRATLVYPQAIGPQTWVQGTEDEEIERGKWRDPSEQQLSWKGEWDLCTKHLLWVLSHLILDIWFKSLNLCTSGSSAVTSKQ